MLKKKDMSGQSQFGGGLGDCCLSLNGVHTNRVGKNYKTIHLEQAQLALILLF